MEHFACHIPGHAVPPSRCFQKCAQTTPLQGKTDTPHSRQEGFFKSSHKVVTLTCHGQGLTGRRKGSTGWQQDHGECLLTFLKRFTLGLVLRRNTSRDASSTLLKRPDIIACVPGKGCYFRGEEKRIDSNEDPRSELHSKLENIWPFPGLDYVLGYHSTGCILID
jgi:hypothetical protein